MTGRGKTSSHSSVLPCAFSTLRLIDLSGSFFLVPVVVIVQATANIVQVDVPVTVAKADFSAVPGGPVGSVTFTQGKHTRDRHIRR